jgi:hypothetical protein
MSSWYRDNFISALLSLNCVLQTCVYILTISTSSAMPVIGYKENKDDDDDKGWEERTALRSPIF